MSRVIPLTRVFQLVASDHDSATENVLFEQFEKDHYFFVDFVINDFSAFFVHVDFLVEKHAIVALF